MSQRFRTKTNQLVKDSKLKQANNQKVEKIKMTSYINMWASEFDYDDQPLNPIYSEEMPEPEPYLGSVAVVNYKRVHGSTYRPYKTGSDAWRESANRALANRAQANFANGKR